MLGRQIYGGDILISKKHEGSIYEAKTLKNEYIASGVIRRVEGSEVDLMDPNGSMPIVAMNTPLKIAVYSSHEGFRMLAGQVYLSNREFMRVVDVVDFVNFERRRFFRVDVNMISRLLVPPEVLAHQGIEAEEPRIVPTRILDLSLCGLLLETDLPLKSGDKLTVHLSLGKAGEEDIELVIRRIGRENSEGKRRIGAEIIELSPRVEQQLCAFLFEKQREHIRRAKSSI